MYASCTELGCKKGCYVGVVFFLFYFLYVEYYSSMETGVTCVNKFKLKISVAMFYILNSYEVKISSDQKVSES